jgi:FkbM family methyltransferase
MSLDLLLAKRLRDPDPEFFFLQVGAYDGKANDPLRESIGRHDLAGMLVEPQPEAFADLDALYGSNPRIALRNVAVADIDGKRAFYSFPPGIPIDRAEQLASLDLNIILKRRKHLKDRLVRTDVSCVTFETLLAKVPRVDLLQIDVEGYDAELIRLFDFERWTPTIVQFESHHLSRANHDSATARLIGHGYRVAVVRGDTLAYREGSL